MSFDWLHFLQVSKYLYANVPKDEASCRSGISRAYYSVFGYARLFCVTQGLLKQSDLRGHDVHQKLISSLKHSEVQEFFTIGTRIDALKIRRQESDYNAFAKNMDDSLLLDTINKAQDVITLMNSY
jgi:hypothetical protein